MRRKVIVVGSGFSGAVLARMIAEDLDHEVLVVEKRSHIGGNMYDAVDEHGILVQKYGPHFLFTDHYRVIEFLERFAPLFPFDPKLLSYIDGQYVCLPFNLKTVQQMIGPKKAEELIRTLRKYFPIFDRVPISELVSHEDEKIRSFGKLLFEKAYRTYTAKMWGLQPEEIEESVLERVPFAVNYDERYQNKDFQYLPKEGFTKLFERMLAHPKIHVQLKTDALLHLTLDEKVHSIQYDGEDIECLIYTGAVDELFKYRYGALPYRSLDIRYTYFKKDSLLPVEIISYPQAAGYTRKTEYRKIMYDDSGAEGTVVATEYPIDYDSKSEIGNIPYYPVLTQESVEKYQLYKNEASKYNELFLCGRLAEFKYYNMDACIEHALDFFEDIKEYLKGSSGIVVGRY